ncbi:EAL domain-containing protein [Shewanella cyperi]|uniref:EAL domain-containing protein n=1 Tax=Shewanella cyperi TaxID=2814292 RepID=A0A974XTS6_9GAMM|nr:EAL domain-containing protein [Shewanella cyperi]QSX30219.1 EAL domain-containing protein [Shewanella cyperi]
MLSLHHLGLRQKLILFAILPLVLLALMGMNRAWELHQATKADNHNSQAIIVAGGIATLLEQLQREQLLILTWPNSSLAELQAFGERSNQLLEQLLESDAVKDLQQEIQPLPGDMRLGNCLDEIRRLGYQLALQRQNQHAVGVAGPLPFGPLKQWLMLLLSQLQYQSQDLQQARAYGELAEVFQLAELSVRENELVPLVLAGKGSLDAFSALALAQEHTLQRAKETFSPAHRHGLGLVQASLTQQKLEQLRRQIQGQYRLRDQVNELEHLVAGSGLLQSFQLYWQGGDNTDLQRFQLDWQAARQLLDAMLGSPFLGEDQQLALGQLHQGLLELKRLSNQRPLPKSSTAAPLVPPLKAALSALQQPSQNMLLDQWHTLTQEHLEQLHALGQEIRLQIAKQSHQQQKLTLFYICFYLLMANLILIASIWLGRKIIASFMNKIAAIARDMRRMADNPNLDISIDIKGSDEIADMALAMNKMLSEYQKFRKDLGRAAAVFEYSAEGIMVTDADNHIEMVNPAFSRITGYSLAEVKGRNPSMLSAHRNPPHLYETMWQSLANQDKWEGEIWNRRKDGQIYPEYLAITVVRNDAGEVVQHIGLFMDISRRKQYEQDIWYQAHFDPLTQLPNRKLFAERLQHEISLARHDERKLAVISLDLDRFKFINDTQGHSLGDELLKAVAARLQSHMGKADFLARIGGDEFVIILPRLANDLAIEQVATRLATCLDGNFELDGQSLGISASMGIGLYPEDGSDVETLCRNAETAMYQAKDDGRNTFRYFTPGLHRAMSERLELEQKLRQAVQTEAFCLHYQPIVDMHQGTVTGVEALLRWPQADGSFISPDRFIPVAEETGLIETLGQWVLEQALADLAKWHARGWPLTMAINVSGAQLQHTKGDGFDMLLAKALERHQLDASQVHIEITESMLMDDNSRGLVNLRRIARLGCDIYLDDFGTGYSSLSYLKKFPISVIKIDRSFVERLPQGESDAGLVRAIVNMGQSLGMKLVAEGIETEAQWQFLASLGCDYGQGYLLSRPHSFEEISAWLPQQQLPGQCVNQ